jgi:hypothetical protein
LAWASSHSVRVPSVRFAVGNLPADGRPPGRLGCPHGSIQATRAPYRPWLNIQIYAYGVNQLAADSTDVRETLTLPDGFDATQRLDLLLREGPVLVVPQTLDVYGRIVADVFVNNQNVAEVLKEEGYAKQK